MRIEVHVFNHNSKKRLKRIERKLDFMLQEVADFKVAVDAAFASVDAALTNIQADEAALLQKITDLEGQIGPNLGADDRAALVAVKDAAAALVARTSALADAIPDAPVPV